MFLCPPLRAQRSLAHATISIKYVARFHGGEEFGSHSLSLRHPSCWRVIQPVTVAKASFCSSARSFLHSHRTWSPPVFRHRVFPVNCVAHSRTELVTTSLPSLFPIRQVSSLSLAEKGDTASIVMPADVPPSEGTTNNTVPATGQNDAAIDPESDDNVPAEAEELQEALSRPPPVNSSYLPLPWKGRLGYVSLPSKQMTCVACHSHCNARPA